MEVNSRTAAVFRSDINGLRAWAVVAVVLYHFDIPGFGGGFIGVDVFFVISGYLMTGIIVKQIERGSFSLMDFYLARGRRIVPALVVLCAVLLTLGWFIMLPSDFKTLSSHLVYALSFLSNVEFWQAAGYFDSASREKWLLHTWSLSVEWQFYLIFPLVLRAAWSIKPGRTVQTWIISLFLAASFAASILVTNSHPSAAFYLLHTRAWEMLLGALVFLLAPKLMLTDNKRHLLQTAGLLMVLLAIIFFSGDYAWPGWRAAVPVVAAALVLIANRESFWTASAIPQWLGDRSYSLYLWHWPVLVSLVYFSLDDNLWAVVVALLTTLLLGHLSYVLVENTSRRWLERQRVRHAAGGLVMACALVVIPAVAIWSQQGVAGRFESKIELAADEVHNFNSRRNPCHPNQGLSLPNCVYGGSDWKVIVAGDSHANTLVTAVEQAQAHVDAGVVEWTYSACTFVFGARIAPNNQALLGGENFKCRDFITWAQSRLNELPGTIPIVVINRYAAVAFGANEDRKLTAEPGLYFSREFSVATPEYLEEFSRGIVQSACELAKRRTVYMVRPIPEMGFNVPKRLSRNMIFGFDGDLSISMESYRERNAWVWAAQNTARDQCGIKILDPTEYLCRDGQCFGSMNGRSLYVDDDHLSEFGNKLLVPMFSEVFDELLDARLQ